MRLLLPFLLVARSPSEDLPAQKQTVLKMAEQSPVEVRMDQPCAGNTNPKQMVDLCLPKMRNDDDKPLQVVAFIHGGGWVNGCPR